ncbi:hypothetical protein CAPTEDRAFT_203320 [Capitella teleta]|uniref:Fibrinogen C-terminal domain-containing protein n=1 Tax=Capitella teleta TaxID=283909 RepID=R7TEB0_CAPTE|nr:hypothetical protein CAPTEDRAFT_203320 [Capitella teleta]|eukprot:ELT89396.1 hypothetical protein CAPTEDRAFT_203320 [Capitella teleta]
MRAILLIVLLHLAIAQQSEEEVDRRMSRLEARIQQLEQAVQSCNVASSMVRDFNQLHLELLDRDARAVESQLLEMRQLVQSALGDVSATEERIASANLATEERLASNVVRQIENMTSLITELTANLTSQMEEQKERINDLEQKTTVKLRYSSTIVANNEQYWISNRKSVGSSGVFVSQGWVKLGHYGNPC